MQQLFVSTRKGLFIVEKKVNGYGVVAHHFHGEPVTQFLVDPRDGKHGAWYAALRMGHFGVKMRKSVDRGETWTEIASPAFPVKPTEGPWADDASAWSNDMVWSLACAGTRAGELWAGCAPAGFFHSKDGGATWQLVESLWLNEKRKAWFGGGYDHAGIHSICVDPRDHRHVTIAISCGGVWTTHDEGASWSLIGEGMLAPYMPEDGVNDPNTQDAHSLKQCAASPEIMWVQHHAGCYRSTDGGKNFTRLTAPTSTDFGFPIACDSNNPLRAWVVPARADTFRYATDGAMHVARTDDGGKTWQVFRRGLPQTHAYDLVYRHGLALANDNTTLAIGSTTGGVWISEDAGESWKEIEARLPPVAAVGFG
jgi:photosystem II stability/assembly factor-like uncharacterized protein